MFLAIRMTTSAVTKLGDAECSMLGNGLVVGSKRLASKGGQEPREEGAMCSVLKAQINDGFLGR